MKFIIQKILEALLRIEQQISQGREQATTRNTNAPVKEIADTEPLAEVMDRHEIMAYLQISKRSFYRLKAKGLLPARRVGGRDYFYKKDIREAMEKALQQGK